MSLSFVRFCCPKFVCRLKGEFWNYLRIQRTPCSYSRFDIVTFLSFPKSTQRTLTLSFQIFSLLSVPFVSFFSPTWVVESGPNLFLRSRVIRISLFLLGTLVLNIIVLEIFKDMYNRPYVLFLMIHTVLSGILILCSHFNFFVCFFCGFVCVSGYSWLVKHLYLRTRQSIPSLPKVFINVMFINYFTHVLISFYYFFISETLNIFPIFL